MERRNLFTAALIGFSLVGCGGGSGGSGGGSEGGGNPGANPPDGPAVPSDPTGSDGGPISYQPRTWSSGFMLNDPSGTTSHPVSDVLANGSVYAAWVQETGSRKDLFATVTSATLAESSQNRDSLQIAKLNEGDTLVRENRFGFGQSLGGVERFRAPVDLAASEDGVAHVAWLQFDGGSDSVYISDYTPQANGWSAAREIDSTDKNCFGVQLLALTSGDTVLIWQQTEGTGGPTSLNGAIYYAATSSWAPAFEISSSIKASEVNPPAVWEQDGSVGIAYLTAETGSADDVLQYRVLNITNGAVEAPVAIDSAGRKASIVATEYAGGPVVFWSELDEFGYFSVMGAKSSGNGWEALPQIEADPNNSGHLALTTLEDKLHLMWKHDAPGGRLYSQELKTAVYNGSTFEATEELLDIGAAHPVLVNGEDGKLYVQWFATHTYYSEYTAATGWQNWSRPFCESEYLGLCYNDGSEHSIDVEGVYGVATWLEKVDGVWSAIISISSN